MYLSHLLINTGNDPDRPDWRISRRWLHNRYRVHQRLCMAFPSRETKSADGNFLKPYHPEGFAVVHVPRDDSHNFLFRIDPQRGSVVISVLSGLKPDWDYAFHNAEFLLKCKPSAPRPPRLDFQAGAALRFRLEANPVYRARASSLDRRGQPIGEKWVRKRLPVEPTDESLRNWLERRAENAGFRLLHLPFIQPGYAYFNQTGERGDRHRLASVRYEGTLEVTDPDLFRKALAAGIGPAKAFGFGLLSVAPA